MNNFEKEREILSFLKKQFSCVGLCDETPSWIEHYSREKDELTLEGWVILELMPEVRKLTKRNELLEKQLRELVDALDKTFWSSWQSTHSFDDQLTNARELLSKLDEERG